MSGTNARGTTPLNGSTSLSAPRTRPPRNPIRASNISQMDSLDPAFPGWARLAPEKLLLCRPSVNRNAYLAVDPRCKEPLDPGPQADPGCSGTAARSRC